MWGMGKSQLGFVQQYAALANLSLIASIPIYLGFPPPPSLGQEVGRHELNAKMLIMGLGKVEI